MNVKDKPTLFEIFGLRFFFFANDHEPIHIHAEKEENRVKIQVTPTVELIENKGMKQKDVKKALSIVRTYREDIINAWNVFFNK
ncbi:MAG: DUF4160 domain-containing protein [Bacteroidales bacterium]|nr:DUF4160 domain-containing protein [Bacteroidales bacterium]MBP3663492.1 DUF4160 domain-containing protein [Bacteroidales bacterium]